MVIQETVGAALVSGGIATVISLVSLLFARAQYRDENRSRYQAERVARRLLKHPKWRLRSFEKIALRLGGFEPDELRQILVRAGAIRFASKVDGEEYWGLYSRTKKLLHFGTISGEELHKIMAREKNERW